MSNVIPLRPSIPIRALPDNSLRADCERLMRRLYRAEIAFERELRDLADLLDMIIAREERRP